MNLKQFFSRFKESILKFVGKLVSKISVTAKGGRYFENSISNVI